MRSIARGATRKRTTMMSARARVTQSPRLRLVPSSVSVGYGGQGQESKG